MKYDRLVACTGRSNVALRQIVHKNLDGIGKKRTSTKISKDESAREVSKPKPQHGGHCHRSISDSSASRGRRRRRISVVNASHGIHHRSVSDSVASHSGSRRRSHDRAAHGSSARKPPQRSYTVHGHGRATPQAHVEDRYPSSSSNNEFFNSDLTAHSAASLGRHTSTPATLRDHDTFDFEPLTVSTDTMPFSGPAEKFCTCWSPGHHPNHHGDISGCLAYREKIAAAESLLALGSSGRRSTR